MATGCRADGNNISRKRGLKAELGSDPSTKHMQFVVDYLGMRVSSWHAATISIARDIPRYAISLTLPNIALSVSTVTRILSMVQKSVDLHYLPKYLVKSCTSMILTFNIDAILFQLANTQMYCHLARPIRPTEEQCILHAKETNENSV